MKYTEIVNILVYFVGVFFVFFGWFGGFEFSSNWLNAPGLNEVTVDKIAPIMGIALMALAKAYTHTN